MKQKIALTLSGGGARGLAHIGVIEKLQENGYEISSIAGTSMGALIGGIYASGKLNEFKKWACKLDKLKIFRLVDFTFSTQGLIKGDKVLNAIQEFIPDKNIEDLSIPYIAVATDLIQKKEVVFDSGSLFKAIRASIAIPTVFTPVKTENGLLVDGGIVNNIPISHIQRTKNDMLVAVNVNADVPVRQIQHSLKDKENHKSAYKNKLKGFYEYLNKIYPSEEDHKDKLGFFDVINETIGLMMYQITKTELKKLQPDLLIEISKDTCGVFDFYKAEELIEIGKQTTKEYIQTNIDE